MKNYPFGRAARTNHEMPCDYQKLLGEADSKGTKVPSGHSVENNESQSISKLSRNLISKAFCLRQSQLYQAKNYKETKQKGQKKRKEKKKHEVDRTSNHNHDITFGEKLIFSIASQNRIGVENAEQGVKPL